MSKYDVLSQFLNSLEAQIVPMTFAEIERVLGFKLPASAREYPAWWSNEHSSHVQARAWMRAGYETEAIDLNGKKLVFKRVQRRAGGVEEDNRPFSPAAPNKKVERHPAIGWLKGTFTIEPRTEATNRAPNGEDWAEWEDSVDRKADLYLAGLNRNK